MKQKTIILTVFLVILIAVGMFIYAKLRSAELSFVDTGSLFSDQKHPIHSSASDSLYI